MGKKKSENIKPKYEKEMLIHQLRSSFNDYKNKVKKILDSTWIDDDGHFCILSDPTVNSQKTPKDQVSEILNDLVEIRERDIPHIPIIDMNEVRSVQKSFKVDETINAVNTLLNTTKLNTARKPVSYRADEAPKSITLGDIQRTITFKFSYCVNGPEVDIRMSELIDMDVLSIKPKIFWNRSEGEPVSIPDNMLEYICIMDYSNGIIHFAATHMISYCIPDGAIIMVHVEIGYKDK